MISRKKPSQGITIVTGGAGFIGSCLLWKLNRDGFRNIIVVDHCAGDEKWKNLVGKQFLDYFQKDEFLERLEAGSISGVKTVVHLGACSSTTLTDADYFLKNNYEYSKRLAAWSMAHGARFIYASSAATYGDGSAGYDDDQDRLHELRPLNIYGYSKHLFDQWAWHRGLFDRITGLKFFNVFGPNEYHKGEMMSVVARRFHDVKSGKPIRLFRSYRSGYRDGEQKRDFIYVKDAVEVLSYFIRNPRTAGLFNLGTGTAHSWNELAQAMFLAVGRKPRILYIDMPREIRGKYQYFTQARMGKLRAAGCRHPFMSLRAAVKDYAVYLEHGTHL